jgi:TolB protein
VKPLLRAVPLCLTALLLAPPNAAYAEDFVINVAPGARSLPLAVPAPVDDGTTSGADRVLWQVLRRDLDMTGYFELQDPAAFLDTSRGVAPGTFEFRDWQLIKSAALVKTSLALEGDQLVCDLYVYDVGTGRKIDGERITASPTEVRYLAHKVADSVLEALTGEEGFFGSRIAAVAKRGESKEIFVMDIDGEGLRRVTSNGSINLSPAWSPDGSEIAWTSYKRGNADIYAKHLGTGRSRTVSASDGVDTGAAWSPDGSRVAVTRSVGGDSDIFVLDARTGAQLAQVSRGGGIDVSPTWSPDGSMLAWASERSGGSQIYVGRADGGGEPRRVTFQGGMNFDPVWSPDGSRIAFVGRDRNFDVFVVGVDGKGMVRITQGQGDNEDPSWSPNGKYLVFSSTRNGKSQIFVSTADGRNQLAVTEGGGWTQPAWGPR